MTQFIDQIFKNNETWIKDKLKVDKDYFNDLSNGQNPEILYIGCSDSRVTAEELMGIKPGEAFVHRNIANMVNNIDLNVQTVLNYSVNQLGVKYIVVCGHYGCGGIKAAMESKDLGILNPWLRNVRDVYRIHRRTLNAIESEPERYKKLVELNVQEQCINLIKTACVQQASKTRDIKVLGWVFDMETGKLIDLEINFKEILKDIMEIYHLGD